MKRQIRWFERLDDHVKRDVRVTPEKRRFKWQFKRSDSDEWDYDSLPTTADWDRLKIEVLRRHQRGRGVGERELQLIDELRARQGASDGA